jgi:hypothetical protein
LPPDIVAAINRQTEQYYMIQEYKFRVQREAEESKRKQIEADGIAAFQKTVSQGISPSYLRWRGIEATLELAKSPNSKIVVIGSGKDGLPIILNSADNPAASEPGTNNGDESKTPETQEAPAGSQGQPGVPGASSAPPAALTPNAPPNAPPGGTGTKSPGRSSSGATPSDADQSADARTSNVAAEEPNSASAAGPLDIPGVRSVLSRISGVLQAGAEATAPTPPSAKPKK